MDGNGAAAMEELHHLEVAQATQATATAGAQAALAAPAAGGMATGAASIAGRASAIVARAADLVIGTLFGPVNANSRVR